LKSRLGAFRHKTRLRGSLFFSYDTLCGRDALCLSLNATAGGGRLNRITE
jgi:hypothetical protein